MIEEFTEEYPYKYEEYQGYTENIHDGLRSPSNINVLLHYHVSPERHPRIDAPAVQAAIKALLEIGAIQHIDGQSGCFETTPLGKVWIELLCRVKPPQQCFVDEFGRAIFQTTKPHEEQR